jgi:hypothetical protein
VSPNQHGFIPGRGVNTAWDKILGEVIHARDIFEFDLKNFFNEVNIEKISEMMKRDGIPESISEMFKSIHLVGVTLPAYVPSTMDELTEELRAKPLSAYDFQPKLKQQAGTSRFVEVLPEAVQSNLLKRLDYSGQLKPSTLLTSFFDVVRSSIKRKRLEGVPQGLPTSPLLSTLLLRNSLERQRDCILYADDGLFYGNLSGGLTVHKAVDAFGGISISLRREITETDEMKSQNVMFNKSKN